MRRLDAQSNAKPVDYRFWNLATIYADESGLAALDDLKCVGNRDGITNLDFAGWICGCSDKPAVRSGKDEEIRFANLLNDDVAFNRDRRG